jgi:pyruvate formate lyase activating enzyme
MGIGSLASQVVKVSPRLFNQVFQLIRIHLTAPGSDASHHLNRFRPAYKLTGLSPTPVETLESAAQIADEEGLQYVYIGNYPGHRRNSTFCPECGEKIIGRMHFAVLSLDVEEGKCRFCGHPIPGIWRDVRLRKSQKTSEVLRSQPAGG